MLPSGRPTCLDARTSSFPRARENLKKNQPRTSNEPRALRRFPAGSGSPSSGHLRPNRAPICDPRCSTFSFLLVSHPPVVCARRSGTRRRHRSSWSGRPTASPPRDSRAHRRRGPLSAARLPSSLRSSPARGLLLLAVLVGARISAQAAAAGACGRSCGTLYTELADGQGGAHRGRAQDLTSGVGRRSRSQGGGRRSSGRRSWWAKPARFGMLQVYDPCV
jgi:hypothetical protein